MFDINGMTFVNAYLNSGTDAMAKKGREQICSEILPNMLLDCREMGCIGGDFNSIIDNRDATKNPETKFSKCLLRLVKLRNWEDSYRRLYPSSNIFSRYYENANTEGASRIDRCYHFGNFIVTHARYVPLAFSDHFSHVFDFKMPGTIFLCQ